MKKLFLLALLFSCTSAPTKKPTEVTPPVTHPPVDDKEFETLISSSACAKKNWTGRGQMPAGFAKGMALTFARSVCRARAGQSVGQLLSKPNTGNDDKDVISWYNSNFKALGMTNETPEKVLRHLYTLGFGLGMRESSGNYCTGRDASAGNTSSETAEAGVFQTSWNAAGASAEMKRLFDEYTLHPNRCMLDVFKEGAGCKSSDATNYGSGDGLAYQKLAKNCPAFATEFAMVSLRVLRRHYGPINTKAAEISGSCNDMLYEVEKVLGTEACNKLL